MSSPSTYKLVQSKIFKIFSDRNNNGDKKLFVKHFAQENFEGFLNERENLRQIRHPNIVKLLSSGWSEKSAWLYFEYYPIGSLEDVRGIVPHGFNEQVCKFIARETLSALAYLHHKGIIHRNISAKKILVTEEGWLKLIDFSRTVYKHPMSAEPYIPGWFAFESGFYDVDDDAECDIYSLGAMMLGEFLNYHFGRETYH
jgi:serine/threonine protein kinase